MRPEPRALRDADTAELADLVNRRRQLVDMRAQESVRLCSARSKALKKSLTQHIEWLDQRIAEATKWR